MPIKKKTNSYQKTLIRIKNKIPPTPLVLVCWFPGRLVPWSSGPLVPWSGPLVPLVPWSSGPLVLWSLGPLVLRPGLRVLVCTFEARRVKGDLEIWSYIL